MSISRTFTYTNGTLVWSSVYKVGSKWVCKALFRDGSVYTESYKTCALASLQVSNLAFCCGSTNRKKI